MLTLSNTYFRICSRLRVDPERDERRLVHEPLDLAPDLIAARVSLRRRAAALLLPLAALIGFPKQAGRVVLDAEHFAVFEHLAADKRVAPFVELELQEVRGRDEAGRTARAGQHEQPVACGRHRDRRSLSSRQAWLALRPTVPPHPPRRVRPACARAARSRPQTSACRLRRSPRRWPRAGCGRTCHHAGTTCTCCADPRPARRRARGPRTPRIRPGCTAGASASCRRGARPRAS